MLVAILPGAYMWAVDSWAHGMNLASLFDPTKVLNIGSVVAGLVTFTIFGWLSGAVFATVYNRLQTGASGK